MPYHLELGSDGHNFPKGKAIVVNTDTGRHSSLNPIPLERAEKQIKLLRAIEHGYNPKTRKTKK